jgi:hypothetical protein
LTFKADTKLTTPITINTNPRHQTTHSNRDDIPLLSAATTTTTTDASKYAASTLNPDASAFTLSFSPSNHYQQTRINNKNSNTDHACSTSDYYSQSDRPSSRSSSERSNCLSPSILSATLPLSYSDDDEEDDNYRKNINDQRQSLNIFIGDKILNLYGSNVDANNNQTSISFDGKFRIILKEKMITFFCQ